MSTTDKVVTCALTIEGPPDFTGGIIFAAVVIACTLVITIGIVAYKYIEAHE